MIRTYPSAPPPAPAPAPAQQPITPKNLQISRAQVLQMQQMLNDMGYDVGAVDGAAGRKTVDALNAFRRDFGLRESGGLDVQSLNTLSAVHQRSGNDAAPYLAAGNSAGADVSPPPVATAQPSFDCARASTSTELAICNNAALSGLDSLLSTLYNGLLAGAKPALAQQINADQKGWIRQRNQCAGDSDCIQMAYSNRLAALQVAGSTSAQISPFVPSALGSVVAAPASGNAPFAAAGPEAGQTVAVRGERDDLRRLLHPPQDINPVKLRFFQGIPIMEYPTSHQFFSLLMLREVPGYFQSAECPLVRSLMAKSVVDKYLVKSSYNSCWLGRDEFQQSDTRQAFHDRYLKALVDFAPAPPFRVAIVGKVNLQSHSVEKGGFPFVPSLKDIMSVGKLMGDLGGGRSRWAPSISDRTIWPDSIVSMDTDAARGFISMVAAWPVHDKYSRETSTGPRSVSLVGIVEISGIDADAKRMDVNVLSLALYDPQLQQKIYDFPVNALIEPFVRGAIPEKLDVQAPVEFDRIYALLRTIEHGDKPVSEETWTQLADSVWQRDRANYANSKTLDTSMGNGDSRRPFFPNPQGYRAGNMEPISAANRAKLEQWATAFKNGLPDEVAITQHAGSGTLTKSRQHAYNAMTGLGARIPASYHNVLQSEGLQTDQVTLWKPANQDFLLAIPNQQSLYTVELEPSKVRPHLSHTLRQQTKFRTAAIKTVTGSEGRQAILIRLEPLSLTLESGLGTVTTHAFNHVPKLDDKSFITAGQVTVSDNPVALSPESVVLSPALIDLMVARAVGENLSEAAMAHIIARRWRFENTEASPMGGRFFVRGKRQPSLDEIHPIIPQFVTWATQALPTVPQQVMIKVPMMNGLQPAGPKKMDWSRFGCFIGTNEDRWLMSSTATRINVDTSRREQALKDGQSGWTPSEERQLIAMRAIVEVADFTQAIGRSCKGKDENLGVTNPATFYMRMSNSIPSTTIDRASSIQQPMANAVFKIKGINHTDARPSHTDLLPKELLDIYKEAGSKSPSSQEGVVIEGELLEIAYFDNAGREVDRLQPDPALSLNEIIKRFHASLEAATPAATDGPYGPDMVGLQLGMSFDEAEKIIRQHMDVGRVFEGQRNHAAVTDAGMLRPLKSGKLFVSADGRELIAIIDEPPAIDRKVLAAWRRVYVPAATVGEADAASALREKYGKPGPYQDVQAGNRNIWRTPAGHHCEPIYRYGQANALSVTWMDEGTMTDLKSGDGKPMLDAAYPAPYFDPTNPSFSALTECGPILTAQLNFDASRAHNRGMKASSMDWIEMTLTDIGPYLKAYSRNRDSLQRAPQEDGTSGASRVNASGIKF
ncbi:peptidoglycan-binding protein [Pollutimonas subterranea]|uniref:peptidoglycan-binding protein n=1 Tax=Pollutimonas subterranea TaxID=2045210 RepID=UPI00130423E0|nr:peptidoglycan-binding protein [Pollutimonas subterranea]